MGWNGTIKSIITIHHLKGYTAYFNFQFNFCDIKYFYATKNAGDNHNLSIVDIHNIDIIISIRGSWALFFS